MDFLCVSLNSIDHNMQDAALEWKEEEFTELHIWINFLSI